VETIWRPGPATTESLTRIGEASTPVSVAVGERPALLLTALARLLASSGLEVRCTATSPSALERCVRRDRPDVVLVDAALGNGDAPLAFVDGLQRAAPATAVVVLVDELTPTLAHAALEHEVAGVVLGSGEIEDIAGSLVQVAAGHSVFPAGWLAAVHRADDQSIFARLSARQLEVLELVAAGLDNARIAQRLHVSRNTVKFHVRVIYERLGVTNRVDAARALGEELSGMSAARV
jgi:two-component system, NarL family, response regulator DevR